MTVPPYHLFQAYGIELEYMLVDARTLSVRPIADQVLKAAAGEIVSDIERGPLAWSNELALHVIELKTNGPAATLKSLAGIFQDDVRQLNALAAPLGARLMPSAMHPWMNPEGELRLWPHECRPIYEAFHRVFDCRGHGWANLQSMHINLPFAGDEEFGRLHAAIRLVLPLLPGLAASSPVYDGRLSGLMDSRLEMYRSNARRIPSVTGRVIPEPAFDRESYDRQILQPMYADIAPFDPGGVLRQEFLNARGAIARFSRGTIEIRVIDVQECPQADIAIAAATTAVLRAIVGGRWSSLAEQQAARIETLEPILLATIRDAERAVIGDRSYLRQFGVPDGRCTVGELWAHLIEQTAADIDDSAREGPLRTILQRGPLARRIRSELAGPEGPAGPAGPDRPAAPAGPAELDAARLREVYARLCDCLEQGTML